MSERTKRQLFLGPESDAALGAATVAVIGVSGGGSHIAQQLAHVGFGTVHLIDPSRAEERHRHRLVGISMAAIRRGWSKVEVARRQMRHAHPEGTVIAHAQRWQGVHTVLRSCDMIFGCIDGYSERDELERYARRFHIPYIDIGMDVHPGDSGHVVCGQVITSMPGDLCMRCMGFLSEAAFKTEAGRYGAAGDHPQVVWPNGVLASTAIGIGTGLLLPWHRDQRPCLYLIYDGNSGCIGPSPRLAHLSPQCSHYGQGQTFGDPLWPKS